MKRLSLRLRSFAAALLVLLVFVPATVITLEQAFTSSLAQSMLDQLRVQSLTLISEFEIDGDTPLMPEQLFNDQLNIPGSGLYAFITVDEDLVWQSLSTLNWEQFPALDAPPVGEELFNENVQLTATFFLFAYTAEFPTSEGFSPVSFYILQDRSTFDTETDMFAKTLWYWLGLMACLLLAMLFASLNAALKPINVLIAEIREAETGHVERINQRFSPELEKLKTSINHLLDTEQQQRQRYKNSLSDLAHSLKTPLAVLSGTEDMPRASEEPLGQINNIIQRQLKRAVAGAGSGWEQAIEISPLVNKLLDAMDKVHIDRQLTLESDIAEDARFRGDDTDLLEVLGNLLDNACKAARSKVMVSASMARRQLIINVDDDGPGIAPEDRDKLLKRGTRLDSYKEGQGIGMAVVSDLIAAYQGQLVIDEAPIGGARIQLCFPY